MFESVFRRHFFTEGAEMCLFAFVIFPLRKKSSWGQCHSYATGAWQQCSWPLPPLDSFLRCLNWMPQYILFNWPFSSHDASHWNSVVRVHHAVSLCGMLSFQLYLQGSNSSQRLDPKANRRAHPASTSWPGLHLNGKKMFPVDAVCPSQE